MAARIQLKRGVEANLPNSGMLSGEPLVTTDRGNLWVAKDATTRIPITPAIDSLTSLPALSGTNDLLIIHDASETNGQKEKKMTIADFKVALNIPEGDTDEKVAVVAGGTAGYIYGTNGTDGKIRMGSSMSWIKDVNNEYVTVDVAVVDGGIF